jgi:hypothetical protein
LLAVTADRRPVSVFALAGVAAVGMTARATTPTGCPANKSAKTAAIAEITPPARLQIVAFDVLSGPINEQTSSFTLKVRVGCTCSVNIKGASVYVTAVPYNQFSIPTELTGDDGTAILVFHRDANFPAGSQQQQLTLVVRATKPGEDPWPAPQSGGSSQSYSANTVPRRPRPHAARPPHLDRRDDSRSVGARVWNGWTTVGRNRSHQTRGARKHVIGLGRQRRGQSCAALCKSPTSQTPQSHAPDWRLHTNAAAS